MSIELLVRGEAPPLGAVGFAQRFALAPQQGVGAVEHIPDHSQFCGRLGCDPPRSHVLHKRGRDIGWSVGHVARSRGQFARDPGHRVAGERNRGGGHPRTRPHRQADNQRDRYRDRGDPGHAVHADDAGPDLPKHHPRYVRSSLYLLASRHAGPPRCDTDPHLGWADVPCTRGSGKLRAIHLMIGEAFYLAVVLGGGSGRCPMAGAERRQR